MTNFRKDNLDNKVTELGIELDEDVKWTNERLIKRLGDFFIENSERPVSWGARYVQSLETVMLCKHLKDEEKNFKVSPFEDDGYIAEFKANGFRFLSVYDPEVGFQIFSRKESVTNYLNGDSTNRVLFIKDGLISRPQDYVGRFPYKFVLDGEITVDSDEKSFEGVEYASIEDFVQSVLGSLPQRAHDFQKAGHKLRFTIFDVMYFEKDPVKVEEFPKYTYKEEELTREQNEWVYANFKDYLDTAGFGKGSEKKAKKLYTYLYSLRTAPKHDVRRYPFRKRRALRKQLVEMLQKNNLPFYEIASEDFYKSAFLETVLREGSEGIILKNLEAPYIAGLRSSRSHRACLKVKQSMSSMLESKDKVEDFDVFITGANPPKSDRIKDMIGSLSCSIYLEDIDGNVKIHEIANVSGLTHAWKKELACVNTETGEITLNPKYLNKVIAVDGLALSGTNLKFQHAILKNKNELEFKAKNPTDCVWTQEALEEMILVRGR